MSVRSVPDFISFLSGTDRGLRPGHSILTWEPFWRTAS